MDLDSRYGDGFKSVQDSDARMGICAGVYDYPVIAA
jgi:hypothetical protein